MDLTRAAFGSAETDHQQRFEDLSLLEDVTREANEAETAEPAMRYALRRVCESWGWEAGHAFRVTGDRQALGTKRACWYRAPRKLRRLREATRQRRFHAGEGLPGLVLASGEPQRIADLTGSEANGCLSRSEITELGLRSWIGVPIRLGGEIHAVLELMGSRPLAELEASEPEEQRMADRRMELLMRIADRLSRVIERERFQRHVIDSIWRQQQHVGRELHENVAQQLAGIAMFGESLRQQLTEASRPEADRCAALVESSREAQQLVGSLARELFPVEMSAGGLPAALEALAGETTANHPVQCDYEGEFTTEALRDETAAHLYRIAQEAVVNATRHAQPNRISLSLCSEGDRLVLRVWDDGAGIHPLAGRGDGTGLRNMRCRAAAIGAQLRVGRAPNRGTVVLCELEPNPARSHSTDPPAGDADPGDAAEPE